MNNIANDYAGAIWEYTTRTLAAGTPASPTTLAAMYAQAVWQYSPRTLVPILTVSSPGSVLVSATGIPVVLTGALTNWLTSRPVFTADSGTIVGSPTYLSDTSATFLYNAPASVPPSAQVSFTDPSTAATATLLVTTVSPSTPGRTRRWFSGLRRLRTRHR